MKKMSLDERKQVSLDILNYIDEVCKRENMSYYLAYGALLGAIRHNGFIPWDDDVDIWVRADDYWKFAELMRKSKYDILFYPYNNGWDMHFMKISDASTVIKDNNTLTKRGVAVDVFPLVKNYSGMLTGLVKVANWYRNPVVCGGKKAIC